MDGKKGKENVSADILKKIKKLKSKRVDEGDAGRLRF